MYMKKTFNIINQIIHIMCASDVSGCTRSTQIGYLISLEFDFEHVLFCFLVSELDRLATDKCFIVFNIAFIRTSPSSGNRHDNE